VAYDPAKRHAYYELTKQLKGREEGVGKSEKLDVIGKKGAPSPRKTTKAEKAEASARLTRLTQKIDRLNKALKEAKKLLAEKRKGAQKSRENKRETEKKNSDGKTTAKEKLADKKYRDKNQGKIAAKRKAAASTKPADMSVDQLEDRVADIGEALRSAKAQVKAAVAEVKSLKHSALDDDAHTASSFGVGLQQNQPRKETVKMTVTLDGTPDFGGWATKAGIKCSDGVTIGHDAFKDMDGLKVPLVYQHIHDELENVLGHAILENRGEGVYAHCFFNDSEKGQLAKITVEHGDLTMMSIYANEIRKGPDNVVTHGTIREVSLVQAAANSGAVIDYVSIHHSSGGETVLEDEAVIRMGLTIQHGDLMEKPLGEVDAAAAEADDDDDPKATWASMTPKQQALAQRLVVTAATAGGDDDPDSNADDEPADDGTTGDAPTEGAETTDAPAEGAETTDTPAEASAPAASDAGVAEHSNTNSNDLKGSDMGTETTLTHNVFDQAAIAHANENGAKLTGIAQDNKYVLSHADKKSIFSDALTSRSTSLRDVIEGFKIQHGIDNIDILFPDAKAVSNTPDWVKRRTEWVDRVINGAKHTPFSRIKSLSADLTLDQARAKGYIKGALKKEEFFAVAKRVTEPQTIYKKQKLDRDDILDITDFDVVVWLKGEMRIMLDEELGRAVLIGDGRSNADDDKILEDKIRPIATDHELFQTTVFVQLGANTDAEKIVDELLLNRRFYKGSGNPDLFTTEEYISRILNVKDDLGRRIYSNIGELASVMRVNSIIPVEVMEEEVGLVAIMVNMIDYTIGTDRGGNVSMFDDFDIDYNQYKYLIETRCSGALTKPKSALVVRRAADDAVYVVPEAPVWDAAAKTVTVADTAGVVYKNRSNGAVLASGQPVVLGQGQELTVITVPVSGSYYIKSNEADEFTFSYDDGLIDGPH
jgi:hypothetical protein